MNYRHIYHAGNFADVFKHAVELTILDYLCQKSKPLTYIDTHAGTGLYSLLSEEAQRSLESKAGIAKLFDAKKPIAELNHYIELVQSFQKNDLVVYPGSAMLASRVLRAGDEMILNEYHPDDYKTLRSTMRDVASCSLHRRDACEFLPAILPPHHRRGLVLIDPPFEEENEFVAIKILLEKAIKRFPTGVYMVWYPLVTIQYLKSIERIYAQLNVPVLNCYMSLKRLPKVRFGMVGCGILLINPPWGMSEKIEAIAKYLVKLFELDSSADYQLQSKLL